MTSARKPKPAARKVAAAKPKAAGRSTGRRNAPAPVLMVDSAADAPAPLDTGTRPATAEAGPTPVVETCAVVRRAGLRLESSCTLRDATDMLFQLLAVDFGDSEICVDGSAVERIDTAGVQMLLAFARHHAARGREIQWVAASPELLRSSRLLGLTEALGLAGMNESGESRGH